VNKLLPRIIVHNSISLDSSLTGFEVNMELHYKIANDFKPEAHLIGSNTIRTGLELYEGEIPEEEINDFEKQKRNTNLPYWIIIDTKGTLKDMLHMCRRFEFCKDLIILISDDTPEEYKSYLEKRNYDYCIVGENHIDLNKALTYLYDKYNIKTILTDTGRILGNILINKDLVSEISLLVHPIIVGNNSYNMFGEVLNKMKLRLIKTEILKEEYMWLIYKIDDKNEI